MNKEAYLNELAQALKMYDKAYVDEIISDYEAHFENGCSREKVRLIYAQSLAVSEMSLTRLRIYSVRIS